MIDIQLRKKILAAHAFSENVQPLQHKQNGRQYYDILQVITDKRHQEEIPLWALRVRPLRCITNDDAIAVAKIETGSKSFQVVKGSGDSVVIVKRNAKDSNEMIVIKKDWNNCTWDNGEDYNDHRSSLLSVASYQYLQGKGYALPFQGYSVKQLEKAGIYHLVEEIG